MKMDREVKATDLEKAAGLKAGDSVISIQNHGPDPALTEGRSYTLTANAHPYYENSEKKDTISLVLFPIEDNSGKETYALSSRFRFQDGELI